MDNYSPRRAAPDDPKDGQSAHDASNVSAAGPSERDYWGEMSRPAKTFSCLVMIIMAAALVAGSAFVINWLFFRGETSDDSTVRVYTPEFPPPDDAEVRQPSVRWAQDTCLEFASSYNPDPGLTIRLTVDSSKQKTSIDGTSYVTLKGRMLAHVTSDPSDAASVGYTCTVDFINGHASVRSFD